MVAGAQGRANPEFGAEVPMATPGLKTDLAAGNKAASLAPQTQVAGASPAPALNKIDPTVAKPSDFVGFDQFATQNADTMTKLADQAASRTNDTRNQASQQLARAEVQARQQGVPVEKTAAYADYLKLQSQAKAAPELPPTGNPYEDALRGIYRQGQTQREDAADTALATSGAARVKSVDEQNAADAEAKKAPAAAPAPASTPYVPPAAAAPPPPTSDPGTNAALYVAGGGAAGGAQDNRGGGNVEGDNLWQQFLNWTQGR